MPELSEEMIKRGEAVLYRRISPELDPETTREIVRQVWTEMAEAIGE